MKNLYLFLAILGSIIPYIFFFDFISQNGLNVVAFSKALFVNGAAAGFSADLLFTSFVFWLWMYRDARTHTVKHWWLVILLNLGIGLSCALPLYFYLREKQKEKMSN